MFSVLIRLVSVEELDCSFNEVEALPSSIGQLTNIRTFAADHNYLQQLPPEVLYFKFALNFFHVIYYSHPVWFYLFSLEIIM